MTPTYDSSPERVARLRDRWRVASLSAGWSFPDDWESPGVPVLVDALVTGRDCLQPARELGTQRAALGVALREGLGDLAALFRVSSDTDPPFPITGSFAEGWADATLDALLGRSATDPLTGFGTVDYLSHRLREISARDRPREESTRREPLPNANATPEHANPEPPGIPETPATREHYSADPIPARTGTPPAREALSPPTKLDEAPPGTGTPPATDEPYRLLLVRPADEPGWHKVVQRSAIARVMDEVLAAGETRATLPSGAFVGVVAATSADEHAARLRHRLTRIADAGYVTIEVRALPRPEELDELARSTG